MFERGPVSAGDPVGEIAGYFADNREALRAQGLLFVIGAGFLLSGQWFPWQHPRRPTGKMSDWVAEALKACSTITVAITPAGTDPPGTR